MITQLVIGIGRTSATIQLYSLAAKGVVHGIIVVPSIQFAGTGMTYYQVSCGIAGDLTKYSAAFDLLNVAPGNTVFQQADLFSQENRGAATSLKITATANVNLSNSTAGQVKVYLLLALTP